MLHTRSEIPPTRMADTHGRTTPDSTRASHRSSRRSALALSIVTALILFGCTACTTTTTHHGSGSAFTALGIVALIAGVALLSAVGKVVGQLVHVLTELAATLAKLGFVAVVVIGAVVVAFAMVAQS